MDRIFAELDDNDLIVNVIAVAETDCLNAEGDFSEATGIDFLRRVYRDAVFVETRYDGTIRRFPAIIGGKYLADLDEFRPPQPEGWYWDDDLGEWVDPNPIEPEPEPEPDET